MNLSRPMEVLWRMPAGPTAGWEGQPGQSGSSTVRCQRGAVSLGKPCRWSVSLVKAKASGLWEIGFPRGCVVCMERKYEHRACGVHVCMTCMECGGI